MRLGLLWIGQGTGVVAWPKTSFMINEIHWALYGAIFTNYFEGRRRSPDRQATEILDVILQGIVGPRGRPGLSFLLKTGKGSRAVETRIRRGGRT